MSKLVKQVLDSVLKNQVETEDESYDRIMKEITDAMTRRAAVGKNQAGWLGYKHEMDTVKQIQDVFLQQGYVFQVDYDEHAEVVLVKVYWGGSNG